jgi:hypothetical protein
MERRRAAGPVADGDEVRAVDLGHRQQRIAIEDADPGGFVGQAGQPLELRRRDAAQVEGALGAFGEPDDDKPEPILAGLIVLFDETALLERGQQSRCCRFVEAQPSGQFRDAGLALRLAEGQEEGGRSIDGADRVAVEDH